MDIEQLKTRIGARWGGALRGAGAVLTGLLLAESFPPIEWNQVAWFALVPLMVSLAFSRPREAIRLGAISGGLFWLLDLAWLLRLNATGNVPLILIGIGWLALALYCALFMVAFATALQWAWARWAGRNLLVNLGLTFVAPVLWVGFEYGRSVLFGGFPWNPLGASQYSFRAVIQMAQWIGVYGVSAMVVLVNAGFAMTVVRYLRRDQTMTGYRPHPELFSAILLLVVVLRVGWDLDAAYGRSGGSLTVAAIQPNVPQNAKWSEEFVADIYGKLERLSREAIVYSQVTRGFKPDLLVWPETSVPDYVRASADCLEFVRRIATNGVPVLVGSMDFEERGGATNYYNSAFLFDASGRILQRYDKQRLVPFGEYIPLEAQIPLLRRLAPLGWSCTAGHAATVFRLREPAVRFSVAICFEDAVAGLSREFVLDGARVLIDQTNDAWFDGSAGAAQHLAQCVFRCVENRVPAVRSANSGLTCFVGRNGRVYHGNPPGRIAEAVDGAAPARTEVYAIGEVAAAEDEMRLTPYTRYGDRLFAIPCAFVALAALVPPLLEWRRRRVTPAPPVA